MGDVARKKKLEASYTKFLLFISFLPYLLHPSRTGISLGALLSSTCNGYFFLTT